MVRAHAYPPVNPSVSHDHRKGPCAKLEDPQPRRYWPDTVSGNGVVPVTSGGPLALGLAVILEVVSARKSHMQNLLDSFDPRSHFSCRL